ncbi:calcium-binding protein [Frigidibacter sp. SD6-1]|uniref:calcium-binding protein n=1 Tax=Frigidibacter sp. SD6-1 TaxID=3032581 RepID=UPI0024DFD334|nr:calcium-binding protein [Frigidibacter sp. SD6-1]
MLMLAGFIGLMAAVAALDVVSAFGGNDETEPPADDHGGVAGTFHEEDPSQEDQPADSARDDGLTDAYRPHPDGEFTGNDDRAPGGQVITGAEVPDILVGTDGGDTIDGRAGDDQIGGYGGDDLIEGQEGDDDLHGMAGDDTLDGGAGDDTLSGGDDNDSLSGGEGDDLLAGQMGDDMLDGGAGADSLLGGAGEDSLSGGAGDDTLEGNDGNDTLDGGTGADVLMGGGGDDVLSDRDPDGEVVRDFLNGGAGDDTLVAGEADWLDGGEGHDSFVLSEWLDEAHEAATIGDYNATEDQIVVVYDAAAHPDPLLSLSPADDGQGEGDMNLFLDGMLVARVLGSPDLAVSDIQLLPAQAA